MADTLNLPADIRAVSESRFILGTDDEGARHLDIDDVVAKDLEQVVGDARMYLGADYFHPSGFRKSRRSDVDPTLVFVDFDGGTLLVDADDAVIGGYVESDLVLDDEWRDRGLGTEIVVEHFLSNGEFPTWWLDSAQYSEMGHRTHLSAHAYPARRPDAYLRKLARHVLLDNREVLAEMALEMDERQLETNLAELLADTPCDDVASAIEAWLAGRAAAPRT